MASFQALEQGTLDKITGILKPLDIFRLRGSLQVSKTVEGAVDLRISLQDNNQALYQNLQQVKSKMLFMDNWQNMDIWNVGVQPGARKAPNT